MRLTAALVILMTIPLGKAVLAQGVSKGTSQSVTVPMMLDQGRVLIDVTLLLPDGTSERVRAWVDNGNPDLYMSVRVASLMGLNLNCDGPICSGTPVSRNASPEIAIGEMRIPLTQREIKVPVGAAGLAPGMNAEINIPSSVLRNYDVLINFPERKFTIGLPGRVKFDGAKSKMVVSSSDGLIRIPGRIENKNYDLALDLGSSINSLSHELFDKLSNAHPDWPHMTGAVGPFNTGEREDEPKWKLMRVDRVQCGPLFLTEVAVADRPPDPAKVGTSSFASHPGISAAGSLSSEALLNYRVGLDYAHSTVYFDIGRTVRFPDFDVVGLILRPENDAAFTVVGIADFDGKPSVAGVQVGDRLVAVGDIPFSDSSLGQVWSLLEGSPGQERKLTIVRAGKQFTVGATVQHFLGDAPRGDDAKRKAKQN